MQSYAQGIRFPPHSNVRRPLRSSLQPPLFSQGSAHVLENLAVNDTPNKTTCGYLEQGVSWISHFGRSKIAVGCMALLEKGSRFGWETCLNDRKRAAFGHTT